jgi:membrane dipeptidase
MPRRQALKSLAQAGAAILAAPFISRGRYRLFAGSQAEYSARAIELVGRSTVIDMQGAFKLGSSPWLGNPDTFKQADWQRFRDSGINIFQPGVGFITSDPYNVVLRYLASWNSFIANHDQWLMRVDSPADLQRVKTSGKVGVMLGVQDSTHFRTAADVDFFYSIGQRVSQLTYNSRNLIGNGAFERRDDGIGAFGVGIIERMNRVGMAVDVAHCGDRTTLDAFDVSKQPVLITHSNCRALAPGQLRCKTDEAIRKVGAAGSVMGITSVRNLVKNDEPTTIEDALNHFDHVRKLIGSEHLGVGSDIDLDGYDDNPKESRATAARLDPRYGFREKFDIEGLDHPKRMFDLTEGLLRRKYSETEIEGILGGNFRRALTQIWTV